MTAFTRRMMLDTVLSAAAAGVFVRPAFAGSQVGAAARPRIIVFDVNETLLDVGALAPQFQRLFGNSGVGQEWFSNVVLYSQGATIAGPYVDFGTIARAALDMTGVAHGVSLVGTDRDAIRRGLISLPAHTDVRDGLQTLRAARFRLVTLTNSAPTAVEQQLKNAGIGEYFERSFPLMRSASSSQPRRCTTSSRENSKSRRPSCGSSPRTRGTSSVPCAPAAQRPLSHGRGRRGIPSQTPPTLLDATCATWPTRSSSATRPNSDCCGSLVEQGCFLARQRITWKRSRRRA